MADSTLPGSGVPNYGKDEEPPPAVAPAPEPIEAPPQPTSHAGPVLLYDPANVNPVAPKPPETHKEFLRDYSYAGPR